MNLGNLKTVARKISPGGTTSRITNSLLELLLNEGAIHTAFLTAALKTNIYFGVTTDTSEYDITNIRSTFLRILPEGLWWNSGSSWTQLKPRTIKWLDDNRPGWRDADSSNPEFYYQHGDILGVYPTPDTTLTNGFRLYLAERGITMTQSTHYPFHKKNDQTTEISQFSILSDSILDYYKWQVKKILSKNEQEIEMYRKVFAENAVMRKTVIESRLDISADLREG